MTEEVKQAVVDETDAPAEPVAEATSAREEPSVDDLLKDYESKVKPAETQPEQKAGGDDLQRRVQDLEKVLSEERYQRDIGPIIKAVRGNIPEEVYNDDDIHDWINREAKKDKRLTQAWLERDTNPAGFNRVVGALGRKLAQRFSNLPDKAATEDRAAVTAAVRGASTKAPEPKPPDFSQMSDAEARKAVKEKFGYTPSF